MKRSMLKLILRKVLEGLLLPAIITLIIILIKHPYVTEDLAKHARRWLSVVFVIVASCAVIAIVFSSVKIVRCFGKLACSGPAKIRPDQALAGISEGITGSAEWCPRPEPVELGALLACVLVYSHMAKVADFMRESVSSYVSEWKREVERQGQEDVTASLTIAAGMINWALREARGRLFSGLPFKLGQLEQIERKVEKIVSEFDRNVLGALTNPHVSHKDRQQEAAENASKLDRLAHKMRDHIQGLLNQAKLQIGKRLRDLKGEPTGPGESRGEVPA